MLKKEQDQRQELRFLLSLFDFFFALP